MRQTIALLLSLLLLLTAGCGSGNRAAGAEENSGETAGEVTETGDQAEETVPRPGGGAGARTRAGAGALRHL